MGPVATFIESLDKSKEMDEAAKQFLKAGQQLVEKRFSLFQAELNLPIGEVKKMPANYLIAAHRTIAVSVGKDSGGIGQQISTIVGSFSSGKIGQAIKNLLATTLNTVLGAFKAGYNQQRDHHVVVNELGGLMRIDYLVLSQNIQAKGIQQRVSNIFGSYLIITSVKTKDVEDDNSYKILVARQFPRISFKAKLLIIKLIKEDIQSNEIELLASEFKDHVPQFQGYLQSLPHLNQELFKNVQEQPEPIKSQKNNIGEDSEQTNIFR